MHDNRMNIVVICLLFLIVPVVFGLLSLLMGKDMSWDLRNYHYYNPHALLTWRYDQDVAPAMLQTWFNPTIDVPWYLMMKYMPAWTVGFALGAVQGLNFSLVYLIAWRMVRRLPPFTRGLVAVAAATFGCVGPIFIMELGSTNHDTTLSVLVLTAVWLLLGAVRSSSRRRYLIVSFAGALMGAATALKLTNAVYAFGSVLALLLAISGREGRIRVFLVYSVAGVGFGMLLFGPWMWFLWERFENPLFPSLNHIFQSPWVRPRSFVFSGFLPDAAWEYFVWPLIFVADPHRVWEWKFEDYRFALLWVTGLLYLIGYVTRASWSYITPDVGKDRIEERDEENFLLYFTFFAFCFWMYMHSVYRYLAPLELLAPLTFGLLLARMGFSRNVLAGLLIGFGIFTVIVLDVPNRKRFDWDEQYVHVDVNMITNPNETLVLILGKAPMAYVIPEFPEGVRFLRPDGNLGLVESDKLMRQIRTTLNHHVGPIYLLFKGSRQGNVFPESLDHFRLEASPDDCHQLRTNANDNLGFCRAVKVAGTS